MNNKMEKHSESLNSHLILDIHLYLETLFPYSVILKHASCGKIMEMVFMKPYTQVAVIAQDTVDWV